MTKKYIGTKIVLAWEQIRYDSPESTTGPLGYAVQYEDGYTSWSPKETFEKAYRVIERDGQALTFGDALYLLKLGNKVERNKWSGEYVCLYDEVGTGRISAIWCTGEKRIEWVPTTEDMLAEDWQVLP